MCCHYAPANTDWAVRTTCENEASDHLEPSKVVSQSCIMRSDSSVLRPSVSCSAFNTLVILSPSVPVFRVREKYYTKRNRQTLVFGNSCITKLSTDSSPKSGMAMLADSAITLPMDYECAVLLNVNHLNLDTLGILCHDLKGLLPISRSTGVMSLFHVH